MNRPVPHVLALATCVLASVVLAAGSVLANDGAVAERLRLRLESGPETSALVVGEERIHAVTTLGRFYQQRLYEPAWTSGGQPLPLAEDLLAALHDAAAEGLRPRDYHLEAIERRLEGLRFGRPGTADPGRVVDLELLLTDAFLLYGSHCLTGRVNPETIDSEWFANRRDADLAAVLARALAEGRARGALAGLLPPQPGYAHLREALARYRTLAGRGGWQPVPEGPKLERGASDERVAALRARLAATGDLAVPGGDPVFDETLEQAVVAFQDRHGLTADGVVGPATLAALNVPVEERVRQIEVNLERWRWLPQDLGSRYILVNTAAFHLDVVETGRPTMEMRVIVGKTYRRTPVFSATMTYLVLNPTWEVPPGIAVKDVLPQVKKDPGYLAKQGMTLLQGWGADQRVVDPAQVDWSAVSGARFPYRFRQAPGPLNALGRVKFMFPNRFNVYLHDTPKRELFGQTERAFSSGCIRIEKPLDLAAHLLAAEPQWSRDAIEQALQRGGERTVKLPEPIPVHLLYWTAWADGNGGVQFRKDLYGRDTPLAAALVEAAPAPGTR